MMNWFLAKYWTPPGAKLHKHHLPSILIASILFAITSVLSPPGIIHQGVVIVVAVTLIAAQLVFGLWAKRRFGSEAPKGSAYYEQT